jgi:tetratricopeptide (TPR) repeat protein
MHAQVPSAATATGLGSRLGRASVVQDEVGFDLLSPATYVPGNGGAPSDLAPGEEASTLDGLRRLGDAGAASEALARLSAPRTLDLRGRSPKPESWDHLERDLLFATGRYRQCLDLCRRYSGSPQAASSARGLARFLLVEGLCLARLAEDARASAPLDAARVLFAQIGDDAGQAAALAALGAAGLRLGRWERARSDFEAARGLYEKTGDEERGSRVRLALGQALLQSGDARGAARVLSAALREARRRGAAGTILRAHVAAAGLHLRSGRLGRAQSSLRRAEARLRDGNFPGEAVLWSFACMDLDLAQSRPADALRRAETMGEIGGEAALRRRVEALIDLDRRAEARAAARDALHSQSTSPVARAVLAALMAVAALRDGRGREAAERIRRAVDSLREAGDAYELCRLSLRCCDEAMKADGGPARPAEDQGMALAEIRDLLLESRYHGKRLGNARLVRRSSRILDDVWLRLPWRDVAEAPGGSGEGSDRKRPSGHYRRHRRLGVENFVTRDPRLLETLEDLDLIARTDLPLLITGESGTGKELIAVAIHGASTRQGRPFVPINCGAIASELHESELFGHLRGAFTGAMTDKIGLFELGDGGTVFLDEIGEMEPRAQVKLLRILETGELRRVGDTRLRRVDVRVVAATNADLAQQVQTGRLRLDLYYRLGGDPVRVPPLRCRRGDIPLLAAHFMEGAKEDAETAPVLSSRARRAAEEAS